LRRSDATWWYRATILALFGALWAGLGVRSASAAGCHVADRPTLGLTFSWETTPERVAAPVATARPTPLVRRTPCSDAVPGPKAPDVSAASSAVVPRNRSNSPAWSEAFAAAEPGLSSRLHAARLDRPPRPI